MSTPFLDKIEKPVSLVKSNIGAIQLYSFEADSSSDDKKKDLEVLFV